jgi:hypothetical protein
VTGRDIEALDVDAREALTTFVSPLEYDQLLLPLTALATCSDLILALAGLRRTAPA